MARKCDTTKNGDKLDEIVQRVAEREMRKVPLRINSTTVLMVVPEKRNEAYAQRWREKTNCLTK